MRNCTLFNYDDFFTSHMTAGNPFPDIGTYLKNLDKGLSSIDEGQLNAAADALIEAYHRRSRIYVFGNGGSASTAAHFECDFNKGVMDASKKRFKFTCLNNNNMIMTAIANDHGYENVFCMQLEDNLKEGDLIMAISGSGNSRNILRAVKYAKSQGNKVISLTGYDGGELLKLSDYPIHVNIDDMQIVEDIHMMIHHLLASVIAKRFGNPLCP